MCESSPLPTYVSLALYSVVTCGIISYCIVQCVNWPFELSEVLLQRVRICSASCQGSWDINILGMIGVGLMNIPAMIAISRVVPSASVDKQARQQRFLFLSSIRSHYFILRLRLLLCDLRRELWVRSSDHRWWGWWKSVGSLWCFSACWACRAHRISHSANPFIVGIKASNMLLRSMQRRKQCDYKRAG